MTRIQKNQNKVIHWCKLRMTYIQNVHLLQLYASTVGVTCHEEQLDTFPLPNTLIGSISEYLILSVLSILFDTFTTFWWFNNIFFLLLFSVSHHSFNTTKSYSALYHQYNIIRCIWSTYLILNIILIFVDFVINNVNVLYHNILIDITDIISNVILILFIFHFVLILELSLIWSS